MKKELELLCNYLKKNGYEDDSKRVEEIMHDITKADSENAKKRLIAMCNPRYLGNLNIEEFDNVYDWQIYLQRQKVKIYNLVMYPHKDSHKAKIIAVFMLTILTLAEGTYTV